MRSFGTVTEYPLPKEYDFDAPSVTPNSLPIVPPFVYPPETEALKEIL